MPSRPDRLHISPDPTPGPHRTNSLETIYWWTPFLGPTASIAAAHISQHAQSQPHAPITVDDLRTMLGLGQLRDRMWRTLDRLERFDVIRFHSTDAITVRTHLRALDSWQVEQLPSNLAVAYRLQHHCER